MYLVHHKTLNVLWSGQTQKKLHRFVQNGNDQHCHREIIVEQYHLFLPKAPHVFKRV